MNIVLCIKQVPDTADIKWTENNTIKREGVESIINPFDTYAIETALKIKDIEKNTNISVITMGPNQAKEVLKKALSVGADKGILLSDKKFSGADTVATSKTLARAISEKCSDFDMIICGQFATDGDTAQTPPSIAQHLNIPSVTYVKKIESIKDGFAIVQREVEDGIEILRVKLPALFCMLKGDYELRRPLIRGFIKAHNSKIETYTHEDINLPLEDIGIKGSPTFVSKAFRPEQKHLCETVLYQEKDSLTKLVDKIKMWSK